MKKFIIGIWRKLFRIDFSKYKSSPIFNEAADSKAKACESCGSTIDVCYDADYACHVCLKCHKAGAAEA